MPFEEYRKALMSSKHNWGDAWMDPGHLPAHGPVDPEQLKSTASISSVDARITDMNRVVPLSKPNLLISSQGWSITALIDSAENFCEVPRESASNPHLQSVITQYDSAGEPLIIDGWHEHPKWPPSFNIDWLQQNGQQTLSARNIHGGNDKKLPLAEFIAMSRAMPPFATPEESERLYGKDAHCPPEWSNQLHDFLPASLLPDAPNNMLSHLPHAERVETLMCYLGIGDTFTACHKDLCGSSGQNIMCYTENGGSSFWFMTESSAVPAVTQYFHRLKQELDHETHVITIEQLREAPFKVYIAEQKLGDMVLVPPRSCHQVVNSGGITIKTSWSRMTIPGLSVAYYHELPIYRRVCRPETYRVKSTIYHALLYHIKTLEEFISQDEQDASFAPNPSDASIPVSMLPTSSSLDKPLISTDKQRLADGLLRLTGLFDDIIIEEFSKEHDSVPCLTTSSDAAQDGHITCDFCGADVFHSFFECRNCVPSESLSDTRPVTEGGVSSGDGLVICPPCFVEGRCCECRRMSVMQRRPFKYLLSDRSRAIKLLQRLQQDYTLGSDHIVLDHKELLSGPHPGINRAACILQEIRMQKRGTRQCRFFRDPSHEVSADCVVACKKCHSGMCFLHILVERGVHASEALIYTEGGEDQDWHQHHKSKKFQKEKQKLLEDEANGTRPVLPHKLVKTALAFGVCRPINPAVCFGWYDRVVEYRKSTAQPDKAITDQPMDLRSMSPLTECSSSAPTILLDADDETSTMQLDSRVDDDQPLTSSKQSQMSDRDSTQAKAKRGRQVMKYVLISSRRSDEILVGKGSAPARAIRRRKPREDLEMERCLNEGEDEPDAEILDLSPTIPSGNTVTRIGPPRAERRAARRRPIVSDSVTSQKRIIPTRIDDDDRPLKKVRMASKDSSQSYRPSGARKPQDATTAGVKKRIVDVHPTRREPQSRYGPLTSPRYTHETDLSLALNNSFENNVSTQFASVSPSSPEARIIPKARRGIIQALEKELKEVRAENIQIKNQLLTLRIAHDQELKPLRMRAEAAEAKVIKLQDQFIAANPMPVNSNVLLGLMQQVAGYGSWPQRSQAHGHAGPSNGGRDWDGHGQGVGLNNNWQPPRYQGGRYDEPSNHMYGAAGQGGGELSGRRYTRKMKDPEQFFVHGQSSDDYTPSNARHAPRQPVERSTEELPGLLPVVNNDEGRETYSARYGEEAEAAEPNRL